MVVKVYRALSSILIRYGFEGVLVGDEGGFGPRLQDNEQAIRMIIEAIDQLSAQVTAAQKAPAR